jgi:hypothetical protein
MALTDGGDGVTKSNGRTMSGTPLDKLLQDDLAPYIGTEATSGCLVLVPAQTGIGKTHSVRQLILQELIAGDAERQDNRRIYYITNSVDNVRQTYEELLGLIDDQLPAEAAALKRQILYLPRQSSQLLSAQEALVERVFQLFALGANKVLQDKWRELCKLRRFVREHPSSHNLVQGSLGKLAEETYRLLVSAIQARQRSDQRLQLSVADMELLDCIVPGDRLSRGEARVAFLTTHKFMSGYQTLRGRAHPIRELGNALLLVDEFDRQNEVILQVMSEQKALDLIELTRTLHANLQQHQVERSSRYEGVEEHFSTLKPMLNEFYQRWHLEFSFNTDGASFEDETVRLFSDRTVTHAHSSEHLFTLNTDQELRKNMIRSEVLSQVNSEEERNQRLSRFINEADWVYRRFIWVMRSSVWRYMQNPALEEDSATLHEAVLSILRHLNLQGLGAIVFAALNVQTSYVDGSRRRDPAAIRAGARTYHDNGLKLTDVRRNDGTRDTVSCYFTGLALTPSGLLARMVEGGARVVGISATATSRTVIKNFDLDYLQGRLGPQFIELTPEQRGAIGEWYRSRRRYTQMGVQIDARFIGENRQLVSALLGEFYGRPVYKSGAALSHLLGRDEDSDFHISWISKLLLAFAEFIEAKHNRYMLALLSRTVSAVRYPKFLEFVHHYLERLAARAGVTYRLFCGMDAQAMASGEFDEVLEHLSNSADKVIVLSAYASMGEGKNPDYAVQRKEDLKQLIWVGDGPAPREARTDIDTLYLEKPTNQLLGSDDKQVGQLLLFHQIMALQEAGWISPSEARNWVKAALKGADHKKHLQLYYLTGDYVWLVRKVIEQAVGRTARTGFKRPVIKLFTDSELAPLLAGDERSGATLSHEYVALTAAAKNIHRERDEGRESSLAYNRAALCTADTLSLIRELMSGFRGASGQLAADSWQALRSQLLTSPTVANPSSGYPRLYIRPPGNEGYRFAGGLEVDQEHMQTDRNLRFFDQAHGGRWISEAESGLPQMMKNPAVRAHFERLGWATEWQPNPLIMNPAAFFNLYKGALGEEGVAAILQQAGIECASLPLTVYELCDALVDPGAGQPPIGIDAKHWRADGLVAQHRSKFDRLHQALGMRRFAYINLFGSAEQPCRYLCNELKPATRKRSSVIAVPGLLDLQTGATLKEHLASLLEWISDADDDCTYNAD